MSEVPVPTTLPSSPGEPHGRGLKLMLKRQIEKVKVKRVRSPKNEGNSDEERATSKYERLERVVRRQLTRGRAARQKFQEMRLSHSNKKKRGRRPDGYASETGSRRVPSQRLEDDDDDEEEKLERRPKTAKRVSVDGQAAVVYPSDALLDEDDDDEDDDEEFDDDDDDDDEDELLDLDDLLDEDFLDSEDYFDDLDLDYEDEAVLRRRIGRAVEDKLRRASLDVRLANIALGFSFAVFSLLLVVNLAPEDKLARALALVAAGIGVILNLESVRKRALRLGARAASAARFARRGSPKQTHRKKPEQKKTKKRSGSVSTTDSPRTPTGRTPKRKNRQGRVSRATTLPPLTNERPLSPDHRKKRSTTRSLSPRRSVPHWHVPRVEAEKEEDNTWSRIPAAKFSLRGPNYMTDRNKIPSANAIYEPVDMHVYDSRGMSRVFDTYPNLLAALGEQQKTPTHHNDVRPLPDYLGLTLNVPKEAPSMRGFWPGSPCYTIVIILKLSDEAKRVMDDMELSSSTTKMPHAYKLLQTWLDSADKDPAMNGRLKGIFFCRPASSSPQEDPPSTPTNESPADLRPLATGFAPPEMPARTAPGDLARPKPQDDSAVTYDRLARAASVDDDDDDEEPSNGRGLPRILQKWNGKPVLMAENASGFSRHRKGISKLYRGPNYVEVCINVGESFSYMGRGAVYVRLVPFSSNCPALGHAR